MPSVLNSAARGLLSAPRYQRAGPDRPCACTAARSTLVGRPALLGRHGAWLGRASRLSTELRAPLVRGLKKRKRRNLRSTLGVSRVLSGAKLAVIGEGPRTSPGRRPSCAPGVTVVCTETGTRAPFQSSNRNPNSGIALFQRVLQLWSNRPARQRSFFGLENGHLRPQIIIFPRCAALLKAAPYRARGNLY